MGIIEHELLHFLISTGVAAIAYYKFKNIKVIFLSYLIGMGVDADHLFDYFAYSGITLFSFNHFLNAEYFCPSGHLFILFHAWEWLILMLLLSRIKIFRPWVYVIFLALLGHLIFDQISNNMAATGYFITLRIINGFDINKVSYGCL